MDEGEDRRTGCVGFWERLAAHQGVNKRAFTGTVSAHYQHFEYSGAKTIGMIEACFSLGRHAQTDRAVSFTDKHGYLVKDLDQGRLFFCSVFKCCHDVYVYKIMYRMM